MRWHATRKSFDSLLERLSASRVSVDEADLLRDTHWNLGQDARLREDLRFRPTPWGRWIDSSAYLANEALFARLHGQPQGPQELEALLQEFEAATHRRCVFCSGDPRFVLADGTVRLSARELTDQPLLEEEVTEIEKYATHLPLHSLRAAAASLPAGEWGKRAQEEVIETLGWMRVAIGKRLNPRMFVARIEGQSMDDGRSGLVDGGYAVFELWPAGTKQHLSVLVRGAFSDPETSSYAVKKYVADPRDTEGRHHRISLVSLNPDKSRYPDIELDVEREEEITIVAKVVHALASDEFVRRPKPVRRAGRRDLKGREAVEKIFSDLSERSDQFFSALPPETEEGSEEARNTWHSELVCLDAESGALHVEVAPLVGLWTFVRKLRIEGDSWKSGELMASNLRLRPNRVPVPPGSGPWRWVAPGFEDDADVDFSALALDRLDPASVHLFRVDALGVGRLLTAPSLFLGQSYRLLLNQNILRSLSSEVDACPLGGGWWLWEIELGPDNLAKVQPLLHEMGFEVGESAARLEWALVPPVAWLSTPKGALYPGFLAQPAPVLAIQGPRVEPSRAATLFLHRPDGGHAIPLPEGSSHLVRLDHLDPGKYSLLLLYDRTRVGPERLDFEVLAQPPAGPVAQWKVTVNGAVTAPPIGTVWSQAERDLADFDPSLGSDFLPLRIEAPPGWPVRVSWGELADEYLATLYVDREGTVDTEELMRAVGERTKRRMVGDLKLDLRELGAFVLRHKRQLRPESIRERVSELVASRGSTVQHLAKDFSQLLSIWYGPLCAALGYEVERFEKSRVDEPPDPVAVFRLVHVERPGAHIARSFVRILLVVEKLSGSLDSQLLAWLDDLCTAERIRDVLISDGLHWAAYRKGSRIQPQVWDLFALAADPGGFESFLRVVAEGV